MIKESSQPSVSGVLRQILDILVGEPELYAPADLANSSHNPMLTDFVEGLVTVSYATRFPVCCKNERKNCCCSALCLGDVSEWVEPLLMSPMVVRSNLALAMLWCWERPLTQLPCLVARPAVEIRCTNNTISSQVDPNSRLFCT